MSLSALEPPSLTLGFITRVQQTINEMLKGRGNQTGTVTLTANAATTTLTDNLLTADSVVVFMPTTANAAAEIGAGGMYVSARNNGSFTITHANNAQTDRVFYYSRHG